MYLKPGEINIEGKGKKKSIANVDRMDDLGHAGTGDDNPVFDGKVT